MELVKASAITFKTIQPTAICDYIAKHPEVILLDVRTKEEFDGKAEPNFGTLKNAINIPIQELQQKVATIETYKQKEIIVFCSHSHRSPQASYHLTQNGFTNVTNMVGGMSVLEKGDCIRK
jgi:rhodanese-related sulfurtransferase